MQSTRYITLRLLTQATRTSRPAPQTLRFLTTTPIRNGKDSKMSTSPPKHEMVYFPKLTSEVRAFGQFRKVLHTGLFSQLVSMEIPVGGDIGDEVHTVDQVLIFTSGEGRATVAGKDQVRSTLLGDTMYHLSLTFFDTGRQSFRRRRRPSRNSAPVHQHIQDPTSGACNCLRSS